MTMRNLVKYLADLLLLSTLPAILVSGLLLRFVIPVGRVARFNKYLMGLHRHSWIDLHFFLALLFMGLAIIHVGLSWKLIVQSTKQHFCRTGKWIFWIFAVNVLLLFGVCWLVVAP